MVWVGVLVGLVVRWAIMREPPVTEMIHFECHACEMTATCVRNEPAEAAWADHMAAHTVVAEFSAFVWEVHQLPMG